MNSLRPFLAFALCLTVALATADPAALDAARALYKEKGKSAEAQKAFEAIAAVDPKCAEAHFFLAQLALRRSDNDKAIALAEKAVALAPGNADYHHTLGDAFGSAAEKASVFSQFGLAKKCVAAYEHAVALAPDKVEFHQSLLEYYRQAPGLVGGGMDKALAEAGVITKLDPLAGHTSYVTVLAGDKKFDEARLHAAELKKLDSMRGRMALASLYSAEKKFDQALAEFDEVLQTAPDDYAALYQLGKLAAQSGQFLDRGLAALRRCLELTPGKTDPGHPAAHWRIGNIHEKKNDPAAARAAYQAALKLEPNFTQAAEALKKLK